MNNDNSKRLDAALREVCDGFMQSLKQGEPSEERFHQVMEAILEVGERMREPDSLDADLRATIDALRRLTLADALPAGTRKGFKRKVGTIARDQIDTWLDTIRATCNHLSHGDKPHQSLIGYCHYLVQYGGGSGDMEWFIQLAIEQVAHPGSQPAHEAEALARLGAVEALPALRKAVERNFDPSDRMFDSVIKKSIYAAIADLEKAAINRPA